MGHALVRGFTGLLLARGGLGLFESANYPAATKAIAEWMPRAERGMAVAVVTAGPGLGAILAPPIVGGLILIGGWESAFLVTGAVGLFWLAVWQWLYHPPEKHPRLRQNERERLLGERLMAADDKPMPTRALLLRRDMIGLICARFVGDGSFYFYVFWLPLYLADTQGFQVRDIALFAWVPFLAADLGALGAGWLSGRLIKSGRSIDSVRKGLIWTGAVLGAVGLGALVAREPWMAIAPISAALFFIQVRASQTFTLPADIFPARDVASVWGVYGAAGSLGAMLVTQGVGWVVDAAGYAPVFLAMALLPILSAALISGLVPDIDERQAALSQTQAA